MTARTGSEARSLFVISREHGELGLALSFLRAQEFVRGAKLLLPEALHASHGGHLTLDASPYGTVEDLLQAVREHEPELVFLFSGYMLVHGRLLSEKSLEGLLAECRERGGRIVTSDPFLGLAETVTPSQMDTRMVLPGRSPLGRWLRSRLIRWVIPHRRVMRVRGLEDLPHLYPTSVPRIDPPDAVSRLTFFNPRTLRPPEGLEPVERRPYPEDEAGQRPCWLFVLSTGDLDCQRHLLGLSGFARVVARLLKQALVAGRHPALLGPPEIVEALSSFPDTVERIAPCSFDEYETRLLSAEYSFHWNASSFSLIPRLANELPVFLFDRGLISHTFEPFYHTALACHLGGWVPPYLDQGRALDPDALAKLAEQQRLPMRVMRERWQASPRPDEVVDRLLREDPADPE